MPFPIPYLRSLRIAGAGGGLAVLVGALVLTGWLTGWMPLVRVREAWTPMVPMTAAGFCLAGAALLTITREMARSQGGEVLWRRLATGLALLVAVVGGRRLGLYWLGWPTRTDMLGFAPGAGPGQMAPMTAAGFLLAGLALCVTARSRFYRSAQWLAAVVIFIGWIGITRYCYGVDESGAAFRMAMPTALLFALLGVGIFYARPDGGFMTLWNGDTAGSVLVRRVFPAAMIIPVAAGWLRLAGEQAGLYGFKTGLSIFAMANVTCFAILAWHTASKLHREDLRRREAENTMRVEQHFSDAVIDSLPGVFYLYDRSGTFLRWNKNFERVTGHDAAEIARMHPLDFFAGAEKRRVAGRIGEVFASGKSEVEARFRAKDGTETPYFFTGVTVTLDGRTCLAGVGIDIAARHDAEARLHALNAELERRVTDRTAQLEAANKELEAFSYSVSHDLRAPLRTVDGYSQAVLEDYGPSLPDEGRRYLHTIRKGAQQMGALIDDLLRFARLSRAPLSMEAVNMNHVVRAALTDLRFRPEGSRVEFRLGDLPGCRGDASLLRQVWVNLLSNAFKYTGRREHARVEAGSRRDGEETVYFVRDNGAGFDMRYAGKLFGVFQRLHRAEDYEGTGVGLAIVQRIVHRHGGRVWAEAEENRGATFYFTLGNNCHERNITDRTAAG